MKTMKCWCRAHPKTILGLLLAVGACAGGAELVYWRHAQLGRAKQALWKGDLAEARTLLTRCLDSSPQDAQVLCLAARLERVEGRYEDAGDLLARCVRHNGPGSLSALEAALLRAQRGDLTDEALLLKTATATNSESPWIFEALARAHLTALRFGPALRRLQQWLEVQPEGVRALELQARIYEHVDRGPEAMEIYKRVLKIQPERWGSRVRLADMLLQGTDVEKAAQHLAILERAHADEADVLRLLGQRDLLRGEVERARNWLERALAANPDSYEVLLQRGRLEMQMDRPGEAEKYLERAIQLKPDSVDAHAALVSCLRKGKKAHSDRQLQKAFTVQRHVQRINEILIDKLPKQPKDAALHAEVGKRFLAIGEERRGVEWLRRALEIDPNYQAALADLAEYQRRHPPDKTAGASESK
jgi:tetratricopeptide (TPR) repeat protein